MLRIEIGCWCSLKSHASKIVLGSYNSYYFSTMFGVGFHKLQGVWLNYYLDMAQLYLEWLETMLEASLDHLAKEKSPTIFNPYFVEDEDNAKK
jgi:hypothetical protein